MKKELKLFVSYCGNDTELKNQLVNNHLQKLVDDYAQGGITVEIIEMESQCVGTWDKWMVEGVESSDVIIPLLTDNACYPKDGMPKRMLDELCIARNKDKYILPLVFCRDIPSEYKAHISRITQIWWPKGDIENKVFEETCRLAKLLLDKIIKGEPIKQYHSTQIVGHTFNSKNTRFVGRTEELEKIRKILTNNNVVILKGEGGIGKTTLAKKFIEENKDMHLEAYIIDASRGIKETIIDFPFDNTPNLSREEKYQVNVAKIRDLSEKTIIILDNYDKEEDGDIDALNDIVSSNCKFLITSRIGVTRLHQHQILDIGRMSDEDLIELVKKVHPGINNNIRKNEEETTRLLKEFFNNVDGLTIAVELAAALMEEGDVELEEINRAIIECQERVMTDRDTARLRSFEHLTKLYSYTQLSEEEKKVLDVVCHIAPNVGIKRKELKSLLELDSNDIINDLVRKTFLRINENKVISMHPLLSDVYYESESVSTKDNSDILAYIVNNEIEQNDILDFVTAKMQNLDRYLYVLSKRNASIDGYECTKARYYNNVGSSYSNLGDYGKALEYILKALDMYEKIYADIPNHPDLAMSYNNVGGIYSKLGDNQKALEYELKALEMKEKIYADIPNHPNLAGGYNNVGFTYAGLGDYEKALEYILKALEMIEKIYADIAHPDLASSYNNVGGIYSKLGDNQKALEYELKALEMYEIIYADIPNHPNLATSYNNVGGTYADLGDYEKALKYILKALEMREKIYADIPNHPDLAMSYNSVGVTYHDLGDYEKALEYKLKALEMYEKIYADIPNHPDLAMSYNNVGVTYADLGDYDKALEYILKAPEYILKALDI